MCLTNLIVVFFFFQDASGWRAGGWSKTDVVLELGGILKAKDAAQLPSSSSFKPPPIHKLFSKMEFIRGSGVNVQQLNEADIVEDRQHFYEDETLGADTRSMEMGQQGGWLDSDGIEEFD